jgi:hypothetical protein
VDKFEVASWAGWLTDEILGVRDELKKIVAGEIERGHCSPGTRECYGGKPGNRKLMLADAKRIAKHMVAKINRMVDEFYEKEPKEKD